MTPTPAERFGAGLASAATTLLALLGPLVGGFVFARAFLPTLHSRYLPWITGRALGIAAYLALVALVALGIWMRHPWRHRVPLWHPETRLRVHALLGASTVALVAGHLASLAADRYAGVGWWGALVPGMSHYRTVAVSLGVVAFFFLLLLGLTARLAGRRGARHWLAYHRLAAANFALVFLHGVLAGSDTVALRGLYLGTGGFVALLAASRYALREARAGTPATPRKRRGELVGAGR